MVLNYKCAFKALPHRNFDLVITQSGSHTDGSNHWLSVPQKGNRRDCSLSKPLCEYEWRILNTIGWRMGCLPSFPLTNFYKMLYVSILSRWRMYITPVTDILVHYCMGKIQEVIFKKFLQLKRKKRKIIVLMFVYICVYKYVKYIYTYAFIYIHMQCFYS